MKRYGDNLPPCSISEDALCHEHGRNTLVMYGGCGVRFGTFSRPVEYPEKRKRLSLLSLFGLRKDKKKS